MKELLDRLYEKTKAYKAYCVNDGLDKGTINNYKKDILNTFIELYKNPDFYVYVTTYEDDIKAIYEQGNDLFFVIFTEELIKQAPKEMNYKKTTLKELCIELYENYNNYELLENPEYIPTSNYTKEGILEYTSYNSKLTGIVCNLFTDYTFYLEKWECKALLLMGMGANQFNLIDENGNTTFTL